jgi:hypothetical protein
VKRSTVSIVIISLALTLALGGCGQREKTVGGPEVTQTIEPAKPQPDLTGSDAMTQTVDVEKGRSEGEGRGTEASTDTTTTTTTAAATVAPTTST